MSPVGAAAQALTNHLLADIEDRVERLGLKSYQKLAVALAAISAVWVRYAIRTTDDFLNPDDRDRLAGARARAAEMLFQVGSSANPELTAETLGLIKGAIDATLIHPNGATEPVSFRSSTEVPALIGADPAFVTETVLADGNALFYASRTGDLNREATKLLRTVKPAMPAVRGLALVTR